MSERIGGPAAVDMRYYLNLDHSFSKKSGNQQHLPYSTGGTKVEGQALFWMALNHPTLRYHSKPVDHVKSPADSDLMVPFSSYLPERPHVQAHWRHLMRDEAPARLNIL